MSRQRYNREILGVLSEMIESYPDLRFIQILSILKLPYIDDDGTDRFYEEPGVTFEKIKTAFEKIKRND